MISGKPADGVPTLDFRDLDRLDPATVSAVTKALRETGFFYLHANLATDRSPISSALLAARKFFQLPIEQKRLVGINRSRNFRGYAGTAEEHTDGNEDLKESFEFAKVIPSPRDRDPPPPYYRMYGENLWPAEAIAPGFRNTLEEYGAILERLGRGVERVLATGLRLTCPQGAAGGYFPGEPSIFSRLIYYDEPDRHDGAAVRLAPHTDHVLFTLMTQDAVGVEMQLRNGTWVEANPPPGAFVVFPGELAQFWSGGYYETCPHRVLNRTLASDRVSITSFFFPDLRHTLAPLDPVAAGLLPVRSLARVLNAGPPSILACEGPTVVGELEWLRLNDIFRGES